MRLLQDSKSRIKRMVPRLKNDWRKIVFGLVALVIISLGLWGVQIYVSFNSHIINSSFAEFRDSSVTLSGFESDPSIATPRLIIWDQIDIDDVPEHCKQAIVSTEDRHFYANIGVDFGGLVRGVIAELTRGDFGSSTISMQVVKISSDSYFDRSPFLKFTEAIQAVKLNQIYSKQEILEIYLNRVYLGNYYYGIQTASLGYFGKPVSELTVPECAYLMGLPKRPEQYNPYKDLASGLERKDLVLELMAKNGYIDQHDLLDYQKTQLVFLEN